MGCFFISYTDSVSAAKAHEVVGFANPSLQVGGVHPNASSYSHTEFTLETHAQLDSFLFPETKMDSLGEHFSKLQEAAATYDQKLVTLSITPEMYKSEGFVSAINFMRAQGSAFSGLNTRTGSLLVLKLNNMATSVQKVFAHLVGTVLVEVRADACSVYD